jgi:hypothetical protein
VAPDASVGIVVAPGRVLQEALGCLRDRLAAASPASMDSLAALLVPTYAGAAPPPHDATPAASAHGPQGRSVVVKGPMVHVRFSDL